MRHLKRHGPRRAHVMENNHGADYMTPTVMYRRRRVFDRRLESVAADEPAIHGQSHRPILFDGHFHRVSSGSACGAVDNPENFCERSASGFSAGPTGHGFCDNVEVGDIARNVGTENGVPDWVEGNYRTLSFHIQCIFDDLAVDRVA